ncbi:AlbA family DNA-binding domain-containing protein [Catelliglobosispora koreensis]|uniref:AlbA family DNA-binding domain-containing protein n=1 Tax=Catelliglobosispora koreensis TaxID=129052 RepID=UPI00035D9743|nr:hypothetical protein [Catelliglobosispora koreensis]
MPLILDTSRALRSHDELVSLIRAVVAAGPQDESRALEWKLGYGDLLSHEASFALARAVLGLANRPVAVARTQFEGVGYVVVGAEPGEIRGQVVPDSAELLNAMRRYTGPAHPVWDPRTVSIDGVLVLVITVEAPSPGDRFALLRKSYQGPKGTLVPEGTIFVRHPGASERATREDIEMLQDRLLGGADAAAETTRREEQRQRQRALIADMVHAGNSWVDTLQILTIASASKRWGTGDIGKWVDTDSGRAMANNMQLITANIRKLRLETTHPDLMAALDAVQAVVRNPEIFDPVWNGTANDADARGTVYQHLNHVKRTFLALEQTGIRVLAD